MLPSYIDGKWSYTTENFDTVTEMCFPDENYDYDEFAVNHIFVGAYDGNKCIGLAILRHSWFKYNLYDLKVNKGYRRHNIGGLNTNVYKGTKQEDKADIYFYLDVKQ